MLKAIKGVISSLAIVLSGSVLSLLAAIGIIVCGVTAGALALICGIMLCVAVAAVPTKRMLKALDTIVAELS